MILWCKPARAEDTENTETVAPKYSLEQQLDFAMGYESNRTLGNRWISWGIYELNCGDHIRFQTGFSFNAASGSINALFLEAGYEKIWNSPYSIRLKFLGNQYVEYARAANSIVPYIHRESPVYFYDLGVNCRFINTNEAQLWNIFYYQTDWVDIIPYYGVGLKFSWKDNRYVLNLAVKNYDEMNAGNVGAYRFCFDFQYTINDKTAVFGNLDLWQSGGIVMTNIYYKTVIRSGIEVKL
jgi:hypothetical protein